jgi:phosphoglycerate-specific signal transduction histidine kinase
MDAIEIISALLGLAVSIVGTAVWQKRHTVRKLIDAVFDAVDDGKITEEEANKIKEILKEL